MAEIILKVKNLSVEFDGEKVLENFNFEVERGEILVVLGPNGAGKTVLLRTLLGFLPYQGEIFWERGIKIGYVPQRVPLAKEVPLTVREFLRLKKRFDEKELEEILNWVQIEKEILKKRIGELSSGQFQRILVAFALSGKPDVLLFDEPVEGIDLAGQEAIYNLLEKLNKEKNLTILLVSHDLNIVFKFAKKVLCLNRKIICCGKPKELLTPAAISNLYGQKVKFYEHRH